MLGVVLGVVPVAVFAGVPVDDGVVAEDPHPAVVARSATEEPSTAIFVMFLARLENPSVVISAFQARLASRVWYGRRRH